MKAKIRFILYLILLVLTFSGLTSIVYNSGGDWLQLSILILLMILSITGLICWTKPVGERLFFFVSLLSLTDIVLIWVFKDSLYLVLLFLTLVIYLLSLPKAKEKVDKKVNEEPHSVVFDPVEQKK